MLNIILVVIAAIVALFMFHPRLIWQHLQGPANRTRSMKESRFWLLRFHLHHHALLANSAMWGKSM